MLRMLFINFWKSVWTVFRQAYLDGLIVAGILLSIASVIAIFVN